VVVRLFARRSNDVTYFTRDSALEIDGLRNGGPGWWLRGDGDTRTTSDVADVFSTSERSVVLGYDIIVAAPRPISILLAIDPHGASGVIDAHRRSVRATIDYLEQHSLVVRDRRFGEDRDETGRWRSIVSYTHGVNRHGEPHLHDHVLVGARPDGARNVLDSRALFAHVSAADALYRSSLRYELPERTKWSAWRSFEGVEHVVGLDEGYRVLWGGHHRERGEKLQWSRGDAVDQWRNDLKRYEPHGERSAPPRDRLVLDEHSFGGTFEGRTDVARRHVVAAWSNAAVYGHDPKVSAVAIDDLYPMLLGARGVREPTIGVRAVRMTSLVRERGARPLSGPDLVQWRQRSRDRSDRSDRSR
jgi:hypothetical protein